MCAQNNNQSPIQTSIDDKNHKAPMLSLVMIAKDEEKNLPRALASARPYVDEIVLVDTGSKDKTVEIAKSFGANVYHHEWKNDFSLHRNQAISYATGEWVLQLDCDEELDRTTAQLLPGLLRNREVNGYLVEIQNIFNTGEKTSFQWPRLFKNLKEIRYHRKVHNQISIPGKTEISGLRLFHYGYTGDEKSLAQKQARRLEMIKKWVKDQPQDWEARHYLSQTLVAQPKTVGKAIQEAQTALDLAKRQNIDKVNLFRVYLPLLQGLSLLEEHQKVLEKALAWQKLVPMHPDPHLFLARAFLGINEWEKAAIASQNFFHLHQKLEENPGSLAPLEINSQGLKYIVLACWCASLANLGEKEKAITLYEKSTDSFEAGPLAKMIVNLVAQHGQEQVALDMVKLSQKKYPDWNFSELLGNSNPTPQKDPKMLCQKAFDFACLGKSEQARELYEEALTIDPGLCGAWFNLAVINFKAGNLSEAKTMLKRCIEIEPTMDCAQRLLDQIRVH